MRFSYSSSSSSLHKLTSILSIFYAETRPCSDFWSHALYYITFNCFYWLNEMISHLKECNFFIAVYTLSLYLTKCIGRCYLKLWFVCIFSKEMWYFAMWYAYNHLEMILYLNMYRINNNRLQNSSYLRIFC